MHKMVHKWCGRWFKRTRCETMENESIG